MNQHETYRWWLDKYPWIQDMQAVYSYAYYWYDCVGENFVYPDDIPFSQFPSQCWNIQLDHLVKGDFSRLPHLESLRFFQQWLLFGLTARVLNITHFSVDMIRLPPNYLRAASIDPIWSNLRDDFRKRMNALPTDECLRVLTEAVQDLLLANHIVRQMIRWFEGHVANPSNVNLPSFMHAWFLIYNCQATGEYLSHTIWVVAVKNVLARGFNSHHVALHRQMAKLETGDAAAEGNILLWQPRFQLRLASVIEMPGSANRKIRVAGVSLMESLPVYWGYNWMFRLPLLEKTGCVSTSIRYGAQPLGNINLVHSLISLEEKRPYKECSLERCIHHLLNADTYQCAHENSCSGPDCKTMEVDQSRLVDILKRGKLPLVDLDPFEPRGSHLKIVEWDERSQYIAMTHCWSEGSGNPRKCALPICQIEVLRTHLKRVWSDRHGETYLRAEARRSNSPHLIMIASREAPLRFWMDTLCIPVEKKYQEYRDLAISRMNQIFLRAFVVLTWSAELRRMTFGESENSAVILRKVQDSVWMTRMWTLSEAVLGGKRVFLGFGDRTLRLHPLWHNLDREEVNTFSSHKRFEGFFSVEQAVQKDSPELALWYILAELRFRQTSRIEDEALIFGNILGLDVMRIMHPKLERPESAPGSPELLAWTKQVQLNQMSRFLSMLTSFPEDVLWCPGPRLPLPGQRWALTSFKWFCLYERSGMPLVHDARPGQISPDGIRVTQEYIRFTNNVDRQFPTRFDLILKKEAALLQTNVEVLFSNVQEDIATNNLTLPDAGNEFESVILINNLPRPEGIAFDKIFTYGGCLLMAKKPSRLSLATSRVLPGRTAIFGQYVKPTRLYMTGHSVIPANSSPMPCMSGSWESQRTFIIG